MPPPTGTYSGIRSDSYRLYLQNGRGRSLLCFSCKCARRIQIATDYRCTAPRRPKPQRGCPRCLQYTVRTWRPSCRLTGLAPRPQLGCSGLVNAASPCLCGGGHGDDCMLCAASGATPQHELRCTGLQRAFRCRRGRWWQLRHRDAPEDGSKLGERDASAMKSKQ